ncbi:hypothetical protein GCM10027277_36150 [Pseudoduganella ginsengisoli]|uniref:Uncharacterized protein n=1 Tax=Pseudoduganella ginsengisoli TaxID=1462440 RepID=A0A6L6PXF6_9BURK|nr:hypothetical protein [Pseudoduganella ginsengisoli]MTW02237.1 hypothetical protein [Pseudoduganella ginsengisoli]
MKTTFALLVLASFALTGCATQPAATTAQVVDTPSKTVKAEYDVPITASRTQRSNVQ